MMVDLTTFTDTKILGFAAVLTVAAILGKQVCSLAIFDKTINRFAIGLGMIPRGEVGLIFASYGATQLTYAGEPVITTSTYSAVVIMVIITTLVTPPLLMTSLLRGDKKKKAA